jgi:CubicO group peptidase (beta-lactamase class C family)
MKNYFILFFLALIFSCTPKKSIIVLKTTPEKIDSVLSSIPDFNGVALIAEKGKPIYHKAFGMALLTTQQKNDTATMFELASISKQFTATIIIKLKEAGKLNYEDAVEKYIPGLPYPGITIRQLLNHTSGLPEYEKLMDKEWDKTKVASNADIIAYLKKFHPVPLFKPGEKYTYSNTGYVLLASIAEKVSGEDFISLCHQWIFDPLKMTSTDIRTKRQKDSIKNFAYGHILSKEKNRFIQADSFPAFNYNFWLGQRKGPGRVSSCSSDLLKWDRALYTDKIVSQASLQEAFTPGKLNDGSSTEYGFGWSLRTNPKLGKVIWHDGDNPGYRTIIVRFVDADKTIILLTNKYLDNFLDIEKKVEEQL